MHIAYDQATRVLLQDGVIILPTDTVYGLACRASAPRAVERMYRIKHREGKPGTLIASSIEQLVEFGFEMKELSRAKNYWPGPISVVLSASKDLSYLHMGKCSLAVRIPADDALCELIEQTGPLATTSANLPDKPTVNSAEQAKALFGNEVDYYLDGGVLSNKAPSQILRLLDNGETERLR